MHCVELGESFPAHIFLQTFASIQPRTSPPEMLICRERTVGSRRPPRRRSGPTPAAARTGTTRRGASAASEEKKRTLREPVGHHSTNARCGPQFALISAYLSSPHIFVKYSYSTHTEVQAHFCLYFFITSEFSFLSSQQLLV